METKVTGYPIEVDLYPKYFRSQKDAEAFAESVNNWIVYVIFSTSTGFYIVDCMYDIHSDERLISTWHNGKKQ